jgi:hypothetical protein
MTSLQAPALMKGLRTWLVNRTEYFKISGFDTLEEGIPPRPSVLAQRG